jgi:hypothetical protein
LPVSRSVPRIVCDIHGDTSAQNQIDAGSGKGFFRGLLIRLNAPHSAIFCDFSKEVMQEGRGVVVCVMAKLQ